MTALAHWKATFDSRDTTRPLSLSLGDGPASASGLPRAQQTMPGDCPCFGKCRLPTCWAGRCGTVVLATYLQARYLRQVPPSPQTDRPRPDWQGKAEPEQQHQHHPLNFCHHDPSIPRFPPSTTSHDDSTDRKPRSNPYPSINSFFPHFIPDFFYATTATMAGGKGKSSGGKSSGGKTSAAEGSKKQQSHSARAGLQVSFGHEIK